MDCLRCRSSLWRFSSASLAFLAAISSLRFILVNASFKMPVKRSKYGYKHSTARLRCFEAPVKSPSLNPILTLIQAFQVQNLMSGHTQDTNTISSSIDPYASGNSFYQRSLCWTSRFDRGPPVPLPPSSTGFPLSLSHPSIQLRNDLDRRQCMFLSFTLPPLLFPI